MSSDRDKKTTYTLDEIDGAIARTFRDFMPLVYVLELKARITQCLNAQIVQRVDIIKDPHN